MLEQPTSQEPLLKLRRELRMTLHESHGKTLCLVEDPISNNFFRIGQVEWTFAKQFDGKTPSQVAYQRTLESEHSNLSSAAAQQMIQWLVANGLVRSSAQKAPRPMPGLAMRFVTGAFFSKFPLFYPDRFFARLSTLR